MLYTRLMGSKPKDTPTYPLDEVMNSNSLGLSDIRSRNLRKAEAAKKQLVAKKFLHVDTPAIEATNAIPPTEHIEQASSLDPAVTVKKKQYSIKVDSEAVHESGMEDVKQEETAEMEANGAEALDPAEFSRQERLRKQREKQVKILVRAECIYW